MNKEKLIQLLVDQRELLQDDLVTILDGLDNQFIDQVCQTIVERFGFMIAEAKQLD